jgi:hypothetical protein
MEIQNDILPALYNQHIDNLADVESIEIGSKYCAVTLRNGNSGVCATLGVDVKGGSEVLGSPDFGRVAHRVLVCAFVNALTNYRCPIDGEGDIFDVIDFGKAQRVVMVGYFFSLACKFKDRGIGLKIFDLDRTERPVEPLSQQKRHLKEADMAIITATTISNKTFNELIAYTPSQSRVYILGPSTPLHDALWGYPQVKGLFGSLFQPNDAMLHRVIREGGGTRDFMGYMRKVYRLKSND